MQDISGRSTWPFCTGGAFTTNAVSRISSKVKRVGAVLRHARPQNRGEPAGTDARLSRASLRTGAGFQLWQHVRVESFRLLAVSHSAMPDLYLMFHFNGRVCRVENHCQSLAVLFRSLFGPSMVEAFMVGVSSVSQCDACSGPALCSEGCPWFPDAPSARRLPHFGCRDECIASKTGLFVLFGCFILVCPSFDAKN